MIGESNIDADRGKCFTSPLRLYPRTFGDSPFEDLVQKHVTVVSDRVGQPVLKVPGRESFEKQCVFRRYPSLAEMN